MGGRMEGLLLDMCGDCEEFLRKERLEKWKENTLPVKSAKIYKTKLSKKAIREAVKKVLQKINISF